MKSRMRISMSDFWRAGKKLFGGLFLSFVLILCCGGVTRGGGLLEEAKYGVGDWEPVLGNHRAVVKVSKAMKRAAVHIPWRRRDADYREKGILVFNGISSERVHNVSVVALEQQYGDIVFEAKEAGEYYVYYMPLEATSPELVDPFGCGGFYDAKYVKLQESADSGWLSVNGSEDDGEVELVEIQSRGEFHSFYPMEVVASDEEVAGLIKGGDRKGYLLFPEDRKNSIRMKDAIPLKWIKSGASDAFRGKADRNEYYAFQVGLYAWESDIADVDVEFSDLVTVSGDLIKASAINCINMGGNDITGKRFEKVVKIDKGMVQAFWCGVLVPEEAKAGVYEGTVEIRPVGLEASVVKLTLEVSGNILEDHGDGDLWRMSRIRWLDSKSGISDEVIRPYTALKVEDLKVICGDREVRFNRNIALPEHIRSGGVDILENPIRFVVEIENEGVIPILGGTSRVVESNDGKMIVESTNLGKGVSLTCSAKMEFDGHIGFDVVVKAQRDVELKNVMLDIPVRREIAEYMMGLGSIGGYRPTEWHWKWDIKSANNEIWLGKIDAGIWCKLKGNEDTWELLSFLETKIPESWHNGGKGGCDVTEVGSKDVLVRAYTGSRSLLKGEELKLRFAIMATPFRTIDYAGHWNQRYYQCSPDYVPIDEVSKAGANISNLHQGLISNPYINYPFVTADELTELVKEGHDKGVKVKIYYTNRELSYKIAEIWALRSLGDEIFATAEPGTLDPWQQGGGSSWLKEHLVDGYIPAWHTRISDGKFDASFVPTGISRWHNYYIESLGWLVENVGIDGVYIDGIMWGRETMKRMRRVMNEAGSGKQILIEFHGGNGFSLSGTTRQSTLLHNIENLCYLDSLWMGEFFNYQTISAERWFLEMSGIPFGLMGETLPLKQFDGANPWRAMVFGMSSRCYSHNQVSDPKLMWDIWDEFKIEDSEMSGFWDDDCPIRTSRSDVHATCYTRRGDKTLVSIGSWAEGPTQIRLQIDWQAIGLDEQKARIVAKAIPTFQDAASFSPSDIIPVDAGKGWLLVIEENSK